MDHRQKCRGSSISINDDAAGWIPSPDLVIGAGAPSSLLAMGPMASIIGPGDGRSAAIAGRGDVVPLEHKILWKARF